MIVSKPGIYLLLKPWSSRGSRSIKHFSAGTMLTITQISEDYKQCIGPEFEDWAHWEMPVERMEPKPTQVTKP